MSDISIMSLSISIGTLRGFLEGFHYEEPSQWLGCGKIITAP